MKKFLQLLKVKLINQIPFTWKENFAQFNHALKFKIKKDGWLTLLGEATIFPIFLLLIWILLILLNGMAV